jgi:hypothetical protein
MWIKEEIKSNQQWSIWTIKRAERVEISFKRVAVWTLIFTNIFFISFFFGRLLKLI